MTTIVPAAMATYRATARKRQIAKEQELAQRQERARELARRAANLLKEEFGAQQVALFGSLAHGLWFSSTSDVDLAAWGLKNEDYLLAVARLQDLSPEFSVDLVAMEHCSSTLRDVVLKEGVTL